MNTPFVYVIVLVTPELAKQWLESNTRNRRVRPGVVARYASLMSGGHWQLSPEPLIFSVTGVLLNGQHRLLAIIRSGVSLQMVICRNVPDDVFKVLDRNAVRSAADALGIPRRRAEVARLAVTLCDRNTFDRNAIQVVDYEIGEMDQLLGDEHDLLEEACGSHKKYFTSAPVRLAAIARILSGTPRDYVHSVYASLARGQLNDVPPVARAWAGQVLSGKATAAGVGGSLQLDILARAWMAFDLSRANNSKIQVKDAGVTAKEIGELINPFQAS